MKAISADLPAPLGPMIVVGRLGSTPKLRPLKSKRPATLVRHTVSVDPNPVAPCLLEGVIRRHPLSQHRNWKSERDQRGGELAYVPL